MTSQYAQPCDNCPFRSDRPFRGLHRERAIDIAEALHRDASFHCHKTVDYSHDSDGRVSSSSRLCIGAATFLEHTRPGGMVANLAFRLGVRCGQIPRKLQHEVPIYQSISEFIEGASN